MLYLGRILLVLVSLFWAVGAWGQTVNDDYTMVIGETKTFNPLDNDTLPQGHRLYKVAAVQNGITAKVTETFQLEISAGSKTGTYSLEYLVSGPVASRDNAGLVTVTVTQPQNRPPQPVLDEYVIETGQSKTVMVTENDTDPDKRDFVNFIRFINVPPEITTGGEDRGDGTQTITAGTKPGVYSMGYRVRDRHGSKATGKVVVTIPAPPPPENRPPRPVEDKFELYVGDVRIVYPLKNDRDPDGHSIRIVKVNGATLDMPAKRISGKSVALSPRKSGEYQLAYIISDSEGARASSVITVIAKDRPIENAPPVAVDDRFNMILGQSLNINPLGNDRDPDKNTLVLDKLGSIPTALSVTEKPGGLLDIQAVGPAGEHRFEYSVKDEPGGLSASAVITVNVAQPAPSNIPPEANDDSFTIAPSTTLVVTPQSNDTDPENATLRLSMPYDISPGLSVEMGLGESYHVTTGTSSGNFGFTYSVLDNAGAADSARVSIIVPAEIIETEEPCRRSNRLNEYINQIDNFAQNLTQNFYTVNPLISELPGENLWPEMERLEHKIAAAPNCSAEVKDRARDISIQLSQLRSTTSGVRPLEELRAEWLQINDQAFVVMPRIDALSANLPRCIPRSQYSAYDTAVGSEMEVVFDLELKRQSLLQDLNFYQPENWDQESFDDLGSEVEALYEDIANCPVETVEATSDEIVVEGDRNNDDGKDDLSWWVWPLGGGLLVTGGLLGFLLKGKGAAATVEAASTTTRVAGRASESLRRIFRTDLKFRKDEGVPFGKSPLIATVTEPGPEPKLPVGHEIPAGLATLTGPFFVLREAYRATGRIGFAQEGVPTNDDVSLGTGFVIAPNLIMTNQHVYQAYKHYLEGDECGGIEFIAERDRDASDYYEFDGNPPIVLPDLDIAIFRTKKKIIGRKPLNRVYVPTDDLMERDVIVVGYPCPFEVDDYILSLVEPDPIFAIKRVTQGKVFRHSTDQDGPFGILFKVDALINGKEEMSAVCHNATTLAGNSGSPVLCAKTGKLLGVHFAGSRSLFGQEAANLAMAIEAILEKEEEEEF